MISLPQCRQLGYTTEVDAKKDDTGDVSIYFNAFSKDGTPKYKGLSVLSAEDATLLRDKLNEILQ
jgi:hypothetical protein